MSFFNKKSQPYSCFDEAGPKTMAPGSHSWASLMELALDEAQKAGRQGEVPVGALIVDKTGTILALAGNRVESRADPAGHAEIIAMREACSKRASPSLAGCFLVTTLEPCLMCAACAVHAKISGIIYGASDPQAGAISSRIDFQQAFANSSPCWQMGGLRGFECARLLNSFFAALRMPGRKK